MINCVCMDYDGPEVCTEKTVKARKPHKCCECSDQINTGDSYELVRGRWEEDWATYRTCQPCATIRADMFGCGFYYGGLAELLWDCHGIRLR
jgi:hypothetical protein